MHAHMHKNTNTLIHAGNMPGAVNLTELNEGLKKFDFGGDEDGPSHLKLRQEDFDIITEQGKLLNSDGELGFSGFYSMILGQMRSFTNRKVVNALNKAEDDNASEQLFALRMIMANVERLSSRIDSIAPPQVTKEKSMKEIMKKWVKGPMIKCFATWKSHLFIADHENVKDHGNQQAHQGDDREQPNQAMLSRLERLEELMSRVATAVFDVKDLAEKSDRRSSEQAMSVERVDSSSTPPFVTPMGPGAGLPPKPYVQPQLVAVVDKDSCSQPELKGKVAECFVYSSPSQPSLPMSHAVANATLPSDITRSASGSIITRSARAHTHTHIPTHNYIHTVVINT
jgi:hypothetical protein